MVVGRTGKALLLAASVALSAACSSTGPKGAPAPSTTGSAPASSAPSVSATTSPSLAGVPVAPVQWHSCPRSGFKGLQCATVQVPRDPRSPGAGGTIGLALDRKPASGSKIGSLLINPGGPGDSGVDFLPGVVGVLSKTLQQHFDLIGFDPPGVGGTAPIDCLDTAGLDRYFHVDPDPPTAAGVDQIIAADRVFAAGCAQRSGPELPYVSTVDAAMDMDVIRADLGDAKLTYLGFSYGSLLGATYAELFPTRVRALVLDGALDPSLSPIQSIDQQSAAFEKEFETALRSCPQTAACPWHPSGDPIAAWNALYQSVRSRPLPARGTSRTVGPAEVLMGSLWASYFTPTWPEMYAALAQASRGDGTGLLSIFDSYTGRTPDGRYSNLLEAFEAISCLDAPAPSIAQVETAVPAARAMAPLIGAADLYGELQCSVWPVPATGRPGPIRAAGAPPIVVVGTTGDPATPYQEAVALASQLQRGVLLTRVGEGHTGYEFSSCIRGYVDAYLVSLTVPPSGIRCPSS